MTQFQSGEFGKNLTGAENEGIYSDMGQFCSSSQKQSGANEWRSEAACNLTAGKNIGEGERIVSVAAGLGLAALGLSRGRLSGLALGAMGAGLLWRGITGRCQCYAMLGINTAEHNLATAVPSQQGYKVERRIVIEKSPAELYRFWHRLENLPQVMRHLKNVERIDQQRSHWKAEGAFGKDVEWDAEILNERENEMIAWRSLPGGDVETAGSIHFKPSLHNGGTEVTLSMKYNPPAGKVGAQIASLFGEGLEEKLDEDLQRFKQVMETGFAAAPGSEHSRGTTPRQFT